MGVNRPVTMPPIRMIGVSSAGRDWSTSFTVFFSGTRSLLGKFFFLPMMATTIIIARPSMMPGIMPHRNSAPVETEAMPE